MTPSRTFRPLPEGLEDRSMPATFAVTTTLDVVDPADGKLSLREAITRANNHTGADTIGCPPASSGSPSAGRGRKATPPATSTSRTA